MSKLLERLLAEELFTSKRSSRRHDDSDLVEVLKFIAKVYEKKEDKEAEKKKKEGDKKKDRVFTFLEVTALLFLIGPFVGWAYNHLLIFLQTH